MLNRGPLKKYSANKKLTHFKRFTQINSATAYEFIYATADGKFWTFDVDEIKFNQISENTLKKLSQSIRIPVTEANVFQLPDETFARYTNAWLITRVPPMTVETLKQAFFGNFGKVQANQYYKAGRYDWNYSGNIAGTTEQPIRGLITPLTSLNVRIDRDININTDDLLAVNGRLYSVENTETQIIQAPATQKITFITLNNVL